MNLLIIKMVSKREKRYYLRTIKKTSREVSKLEELGKRLTNELFSIRKYSNMCARSYNTLHSMYSELQIRNGTLWNERSELNVENKSLNDNNSDLTQTQQELSFNLNKITDENTVLKKEIADLNEENEALSKCISNSYNKQQELTNSFTDDNLQSSHC